MKKENPDEIIDSLQREGVIDQKLKKMCHEWTKAETMLTLRRLFGDEDQNTRSNTGRDSIVIIHLILILKYRLRAIFDLK